MALIEWQPEYNVGIKIIDEQHKLLVELINSLYQSHIFNHDRQVLEKLLSKIGNYAATHFAREEHYFELYGYPDAEEHLAEHDYFEDMLFQFEEQYLAGKQDLSITVLNFLSDWLIKHINGSDCDYVPFLKKQGVK